MIRDALALDPMISIRALQKTVVYNTKRPIGDKYLMRLLGKIRGEVLAQADRQQMSERITELRERFRVLRKELYKIIYWEARYFPELGIQRPTNQERMNAMRSVAQMDVALIKTEADLGAFRKKGSPIEEIINDPGLPSELHEQFIGIFRQWKFSQPEDNGKEPGMEMSIVTNPKSRDGAPPSTVRARSQDYPVKVPN